MTRFGGASAPVPTCNLELDLNGDGFLQVALPTSAKTAKGEALIDVAGKVHAAGGRIEIKAATAQHALREAITFRAPCRRVRFTGAAARSMSAAGSLFRRATARAERSTSAVI
jgi:hypothetical protein